VYDVCIVTPGYISSTPRVVREADALTASGYRVRVIFSQGDLAQVRHHDGLLLQEKCWQWSAVKWARDRVEERRRYWRVTLRYQLARRLPEVLWSWGGLAERAEGRLYPELARAAAAEPARLFIGHYPVGLAAAAFAASVWNGKLGYDAEDLHTGELPLTPVGQRHTRRIAHIEGKYLSQCWQVTAASEGIANALRERYGVPLPVAIHNTYPLADRQVIDGQCKDRQGAALSLYWFSQTIGLDRGIQDVIRAAGLLPMPVQIHLRGSVSPTVRTELETLAREARVADCVFFHPQVPPMELLSRAAEHDVGVALELDQTLSRSLSVTNKLFLYLLAALAVAATDVPGQRRILDSCPQAGFLYRPGDSQTLAARFEQWQREPHTLRASKDAALKAAQTTWNWERESQKLVHCVASVLEKSHS
jgi:glycosyltransferase involved in cell wall biosynthesis